MSMFSERVQEQAKEWTRTYCLCAMRERSICVEIQGEDVAEMLFDISPFTSADGMQKLLDRIDGGAFFGFDVLRSLRTMSFETPMIESIIISANTHRSTKGGWTREQLLVEMEKQLRGYE